ncbi:YecR family lipoprotein [Pseudoxanthomonas sangjuensis]|uniref:YecR family lipoprotein n=1 Tax=Pseudoxanthomonas sangjuensis TaxID=1503750 RepID=UPI001391D726
MKTIALFSFALLCLTGCATSNSLTAARGEQPGTVVLAYETGTPEAPSWSLQHLNLVATHHCELQGYSHTERDVLVTQQCSASDASGKCSAWQVRNAYQCAGNAVARPGLPPPSPPSLVARSR